MYPGPTRDAIDERLAACVARLASTGERAFDALRERGLVGPDGERPVLALPGTFGRWVAEALVLESSDPRPGVAESIERHYLDWLPAGLVEQRGRTDPAHARLFHAPLDLARMPRLRGAFDLYDRLCDDAGVTGLERPSPGFTVSGLYGTTHFGALAPILHCTPADASRMQRALDDGTPVESVVDRWLTSPLVHELAHGRRDREALMPPLLDEALAGWFGQRSFPGFAFPDDDAHAIYLAPRFTQLGLSFVRTFGEAAVWRAHTGRVPWDDVLPAGVKDALGRIGRALHATDRTLHFLPKALRPVAWAKLFAWARAVTDSTLLDLDAAEERDWDSLDVGPERPEDARFASEALDAMCLGAKVDRGAYVVERRWPGEVRIDLVQATVTRKKRDDPLEYEAPLHLFPPATALRLRRRGPESIVVSLEGPGDVRAAVDRLFEGAPFVSPDPVR